MQSKSRTSLSELSLMKCLSGPKVFRTVPKCAILKVHLKATLKMKEKPKSKLGLLRVTMGLDKFPNQSLQGD